MTVNLLHKIHDKIDDRLVRQIGTVLVENEDRTRAGIAATAPSLLRAIIGVAATEWGTQMVERELDPFDVSVIHDYGQQLEFDKSRHLIEDGSQMVQAFLGNGTVRVMGIISRESGLGATKCRSLTGLLMPLVLGVIGELRQERNLGTVAFQRLLEHQADYVARKIPDGVCAALNLPELEKTPFYPPQSHPARRPFLPAMKEPAGNSLVRDASANQPSAAVDDHRRVRRPAGPHKSSRRTSNGDDYSESGWEWMWGVILPMVLLVALLGWLFSRSQDRETTGNEPATANTQEDSQSKRVATASIPNWDDPAPVTSHELGPAEFGDDIPSIAPDFDLEDEEEDQNSPASAPPLDDALSQESPAKAPANDIEAPPAASDDEATNDRSGEDE